MPSFSPPSGAMPASATALLPPPPTTAEPPRPLAAEPPVPLAAGWHRLALAAGAPPAGDMGCVVLGAGSAASPPLPPPGTPLAGCSPFVFAFSSPHATHAHSHANRAIQAPPRIVHLLTAR